MTGAIIATTVAGATCLVAQTGPGAGAAMPPAGAMPDPDKPIATINGKDINNKAFYDILMQVAGLRVFQQVYDLTLVNNACVLSGLPTQGPEFDKRLRDEYQKTLDSLNITFAKPDKLPGTRPAADETKDYENSIREQGLNQVLQRQGITAVEFRIGLETRANLRAMAQANAKITVTLDEIKEAYTSEFGERRTVHIFPLTNEITAAAVRAALSEDPKKTPEEVAQAKKWPQPATYTISTNAKGIDEIRKVVFDTLKTGGDISAATEVKGQNGQPNQTVLIKLDSITPDSTAKNPLNQKETEQKVHDFKEGQWMNNQLAILRGNAAVQINDKYLVEQFNNINEAMKRQAAAAAAAQAGATPTGTVPATGPGRIAPITGTRP